MELEDINSLCRLCGTYSDKMIDVLNGFQDSNESKDQSTNILEIIHNCLPVQVYE